MSKETTETILVLAYIIPMAIVILWTALEKLRKKKLSWRWYWSMVGLAFIPAYNFEMALVIVLDCLHVEELINRRKKRDR